MFGFGKKIEIKKLDINEGYRRYVKNPDKIVIICADEVKDYDNLHIADAECLPLRLMDKFEEYYPEQDLIYYVYAINPAISERAYKKIAKKGYHVYDLGGYVNYHEIEEGLNAKKRNRRRKK
ncbi:hypothetical protein [Candidatus Stoquefichus massiliensis]|uniref:hypothetical protein n=1 Tax=Candidatus Stoquefichus massiliensis TaxID=1470350 RepID=UPI000481593C|nr:hypothetical protein [Candidatus Stoquefichus massiliensis]